MKPGVLEYRDWRTPEEGPDLPTDALRKLSAFASDHELLIEVTVYGRPRELKAPRRLSKGSRSDSGASEGV